MSLRAMHNPNIVSRQQTRDRILLVQAMQGNSFAQSILKRQALRRELRTQEREHTAERQYTRYVSRPDGGRVKKDGTIVSHRRHALVGLADQLEKFEPAPGILGKLGLRKGTWVPQQSEIVLRRTQHHLQRRQEDSRFGGRFPATYLSLAS